MHYKINHKKKLISGVEHQFESQTFKIWTRLDF